MKALPTNVVPYRRTPEFTNSSVPSDLLHAHRTKAAVWGKIVVLAGTLIYRILEPAEEEVSLTPEHFGVIEPTTKHEVVPQSGVRFYVQFYREAAPNIATAHKRGLVMHVSTLRPGQRQIPFRSLIPFLLIAFGLTWGIFALLILFTEPVERIFGELSGHHPLFILAVYAPAIAAFSIVTYHAGLRGLRQYLSRLLLWRCSAAWYAFLLLGVPLIFVVGALWKGSLFTDEFPFDSFQAVVAVLALTLIIGPVEEFGWRGLALPLLQRRLAPIWASLAIGIIWGFWHLPAFLLGGTPQSAWSFTPFFAGTIALSVIVTPLFNASRGSILLPALFHFQLTNPLWPDAQPYDTVVVIIVAAGVVWLNREAMFSREQAVTEVVPPIKTRLGGRDIENATDVEG